MITFEVSLSEYFCASKYTAEYLLTYETSCEKDFRVCGRINVDNPATETDNYCRATNIKMLKYKTPDFLFRKDVSEIWATTEDSTNNIGSMYISSETELRLQE